MERKTIVSAYEKHRVQFGINAVERKTFQGRIYAGWSLLEAQNTPRLSRSEIGKLWQKQSYLNYVAKKAHEQKQMEADQRMKAQMLDHYKKMEELEKNYKKEEEKRMFIFQVVIFIILLAIFILTICKNLWMC